MRLASKSRVQHSHASPGRTAPKLVISTPQASLCGSVNASRRLIAAASAACRVSGTWAAAAAAAAALLAAPPSLLRLRGLPPLALGSTPSTRPKSRAISMRER